MAVSHYPNFRLPFRENLDHRYSSGALLSRLRESYLISMGRRAKNKQAAPEPFAPAKGANDQPSAKKLGKRKADADVDAKESLGKRPVKKAREDDERSQKVSNAKAKKTQAVEKGRKLSGKSKPKKRKDEDEDEDDDGASASSSEGWEGVADDEDLGAQAKCVSHNQH